MENEKVFNRLTISRYDFKKCKAFLGKLTSNNFRSGSIEFEALLISAIIAYSRPFSGNESSNNAKAASRVDKAILRELTKDELEFHEKIIKLRNKAIAHIEWENSPTGIDENGTISTMPFSLLNKFGSTEEIIKLQDLVEKVLSETTHVSAEKYFLMDHKNSLL